VPAAKKKTAKRWLRANVLSFIRNKLKIFNTNFLCYHIKAFYGDEATAANEFRYAWLPKRNPAKDYSVYGIFESALAGSMKMLWIVGQNPAVTMPNLKLTLDAMGKLDMLVVQELWETETAAFWQRPGLDPKSIPTEVILLPAAFFMEKQGSVTNSGAMVQWRYATVKPPGQAKPDGEIVDLVFRRVRELVKDSSDPKDEIIRKASWTYTNPEDVLREINGRILRNVGTDLKAGALASGVGDLLHEDGSSSSGCWIYAGVFGGGENLSKRRDSRTDPGGLGLFPNFGWTWPNNKRILYNRASCDRHGKPYRTQHRKRKQPGPATGVENLCPARNRQRMVFEVLIKRAAVTVQLEGQIIEPGDPVVVRARASLIFGCS